MCADIDDTTTFIPHGGAAPGDMHLIADVHCRDGDIVRLAITRAASASLCTWRR
jgi:hypothetical protein